MKRCEVQRMNIKLANIAAEEAGKFYHGTAMGVFTNLEPISDLFPTSKTWNLDSWNNCWCAAFVYFCCRQAGIDLPVKYPDERVSNNFAGCNAWDEWAKLPEVNRWYGADEICQAGDIVLFDNVFENKEHDHIGVIIEVFDDYIITAEGNFNNVSAIVKRSLNEHIRGYVRM